MCEPASFAFTCHCGKKIECVAHDRAEAEKIAGASGWKTLDPMDGSPNVMVCCYGCARERNRGKPWLCNSVVYTGGDPPLKMCRKPAQFEVQCNPYVICGECLLKLLLASDGTGQRRYSDAFLGIRLLPEGGHPGDIFKGEPAKCAEESGK